MKIRLQRGSVRFRLRQPLLDFLGKSAVVLHGIPGRRYSVEVSNDSAGGRVWVEVDEQLLVGPTLLANLPLSEANRWVRLREIP